MVLRSKGLNKPLKTGISNFQSNCFKGQAFQFRKNVLRFKGWHQININPSCRLWTSVTNIYIGRKGLRDEQENWATFQQTCFSIKKSMSLKRWTMVKIQLFLLNTEVSIHKRPFTVTIILTEVGRRSWQHVIHLTWTYWLPIITPLWHDTELQIQFNELAELDLLFRAMFGRR